MFAVLALICPALIVQGSVLCKPQLPGTWQCCWFRWAAVSSPLVPVVLLCFLAGNQAASGETHKGPGRRPRVPGVKAARSPIDSAVPLGIASLRALKTKQLQDTTAAGHNSCTPHRGANHKCGCAMADAEHSVCLMQHHGISSGFVAGLCLELHFFFQFVPVCAAAVLLGVF